MSDKEIDKPSSKLSTYKEIAELIGLYAKWGTLAVGGLCLLIYSNEIDQFPEGINLGEGLAFYLVSAGFLIAYTVFAIAVTAMGSVLMALPTNIFERSRHNRSVTSRAHIESQLKPDYSPMWSGPVLGIGCLGLIIWVLYSLKNPFNGITFAPVPLMQGLLIALLLGVQQRLAVLDVNLVLGGSNAEEIDRKRANNRFAQKCFFIGLVVCPMLLAPNRTFLVDAGFRIAQLRKDNATIHVKKPWADRVANSTLKQRSSFLGNDYVEFDHVDVLLRSVGTKVVISLPQASDKPVTRLSIPSEAIVVE
ncbi:hypothetical protein GTP41_19330 [Pseudoduganella sp. DS3]|uniref:Uncharacterized protein n=1 Tax=Pseudoduganella guangdongensis TaxID=2692179 RepID=A0A6N9HKR7_9BURK|nr:hypothetical protein [Pseudoduganella guangdongensis]MYN04248.1 hypothetical protein [Pseudoduganella guangdongensis]